MICLRAMNADTSTYPADITVGDARARYFAAAGFGDDGNYELTWIPLTFGPITVPIYNSQARRRAVRLHDLHHIATGYPTSPKGEALVATWELASGTKDKWFAFFINLPALVYGFVLWPRDCWAAWTRGRRSSNLYGREYGDDLLALTVGELKALTVATADSGRQA